MDKQIIDKLVKFGLITNICVDPDKYINVDDLINKGIITIPGAKERIIELLKDEIIVEENVEPVATVIEPEKEPEVEPVTESTPKRKKQTKTI